MKLKYIGSEGSPDEGILWGIAMKKGAVVDLSGHPDAESLAEHPWFAKVAGDAATIAPAASVIVDRPAVETAEADCIDEPNAFDASPGDVVKPRRKRRTKAEMEAARAGENGDADQDSE